MHKRILTLCALAALLLCASSASAAGVPHMIPLSGTLTDAQGVALEGPHKLDIIWFDLAGEQLHEEQVELDGPTLDHMAGKTENPDDSPLYSAAMRGELYEVELVIDGEVMSPRIRLGSVPYAMLAGRASEAAIASNCISLADRPASDYIAREDHSWTALADKPEFQVTPPLVVGASTHSYLFSLAPCDEDQMLITAGGQWSCQGAHSAPAVVLGSTTLEATSQNTLELRQGAIQDQHIQAPGLSPNAIAGKAIVAVSMTSQTLMDTLFGADGRVAIGAGIGSPLLPQHPSAQLHVGGLVVANQFALAQPTERTLALAPEHFKLRGSHYDQNIELSTQDGSLFMSYGFAGVTFSAPLALPQDARVTGISCQRLMTSGSLAGSIRLVEFSTLGSFQRTVLANLPFDLPNPSSQVQSWASPALNLNLARTTPPEATRFGIEVDWRPDQPGEQAKLAGCHLHYTSSAL